MPFRLVTIACAAVFATTTVGTATAATALFPRPGDVDRQGTTIDTFAIERADRGLCLFRRTHSDEAETPRTTALAIHHHIDFDYVAMGGKSLLKVIFGR